MGDLPMKHMRVSQDIVPLGQFKSKAAEYLKRLAERNHPMVITQNGRPAAVLLSPSEFDRLIEKHRFLLSVASGLEDAESDRIMNTAELKKRLSERRDERGSE
jgi:prevent-host-death family protein